MARIDLTAAHLRGILHYCPTSGAFTWIRPTSNRVKAGAVAGNVTQHGYIDIGLLGTRYYAHRLAWLYMTGNWPTNEIDHRDRNGLNNSFSNLREATHKQNMENRRIGLNNTTGERGICWNRSIGRWVAYVKDNGRHVHVGCFTDKRSALAARREAARRVYTHSDS